MLKSYFILASKQLAVSIASSYIILKSLEYYYKKI
jgi:hypothetical protein